MVRIACLSLCFITVSMAALAQDGPAESRITRVGLFKNGVGLVERTITLPGDGTFFLAPAPSPLHGTVWLASDAEVGARLVTRPVALERADASQPLYGALLGKRIKLLTGELPDQYVEGVLEALMPLGPKLDANPQQRRDRYGRVDSMYSWGYSPGIDRVMLVVRGATERYFVTPGSVKMVVETNPGDLDGTTITEDVPSLDFTARRVPRGGGTITITYLTEGLSWAPSYRLSLSGRDRFGLEHQALLINEVEDLTDVAVEVITGFPSIAFRNTQSPIGPGTSLDLFLQQLAAPENAADSVTITNQAAYLGRSGGGGGAGGGFGRGGRVTLPPSSLSAGDADLHYLSLGARSIDEGEVQTVSLGKESGTHRKQLLWTVVNERMDGRLNMQQVDDPRMQYPGLWDAILFENPFDRPLTTAPCMMELDGRFLGQTVLYWTPPGKEATLPLTKALGVPTDIREDQTRTWRDPDTGRTLQENKVTLSLTNPRPETQKVSLRYYVLATSVDVPQVNEADAEIVVAASWSDLYLITATWDVSPNAESSFEFSYVRRD